MSRPDWDTRTIDTRAVIVIKTISAAAMAMTFLRIDRLINAAPRPMAQQGSIVRRHRLGNRGARAAENRGSDGKPETMIRLYHDVFLEAMALGSKEDQLEQEGRW